MADLDDPSAELVAQAMDEKTGRGWTTSKGRHQVDILRYEVKRLTEQLALVKGLCESAQGRADLANENLRELKEANAEILAALKLFASASMGSSNGRGETSIGWQKGEGPTAYERQKTARAVIEKFAPKGDN
jgi:hypothetical protein